MLIRKRIKKALLESDLLDEDTLRNKFKAENKLCSYQFIERFESERVLKEKEYLELILNHEEIIEKIYNKYNDELNHDIDIKIMDECIHAGVSKYLADLGGLTINNHPNCDASLIVMIEFFKKEEDYNNEN